MKKISEPKFKINDTILHLQFGWGTVDGETSDSILVSFQKDGSCFTKVDFFKNGKFLFGDFLPCLLTVEEAVKLGHFPRKKMSTIETLDFLDVLIKDVEAPEILKKRLEECEQALRFYASPFNWDGNWGAEDSKLSVINSDDIQNYPDKELDVGGKLARAYFEKWGEK